MVSSKPSRRWMRTGSHAKIVVAILILAIGGLSGPFYLPVFFWSLLPHLILILMLFVVGIVIEALLNIFLCKGPVRDRVRSGTSWVAVVGCSMVLSAILGIMVTRDLVHLAFLDAQSYVAKAVTFINAAKAKNEPYDLKSIEAKLGPLPDHLNCNSEGNIGGFVYFDEDYEGIFTYDFSTKTWHYETGSGF